MASVTFEVDEKSIRYVREDPSYEKTCVILLLLIVASIIANVAVIISILTSSSHKGQIFYSICSLLCLANLVEALLNMTLSCVLQSSWTDLFHLLGGSSLNIFCHQHSAGLHLTVILQNYGLVIISIHRFIVVKHSCLDNTAIKPMKFYWMKPFSLATWIAGIALVIPTAAGLGSCRLFQERGVGSIANASDHILTTIYVCILLILGTCVPWCLILFYWVQLGTSLLQEKKRLQDIELNALQRAASHNSPVRGLGSSLGMSIPRWSQIWGEGGEVMGEGFRPFVATFLLVWLYFIMVLPNSVYTQITQFYTSYIVSVDHSPFEIDSSSLIPAEMRPIVTSTWDNAFTWLRFIYPVFVPMIVLIFFRDIRRKIFRFNSSSAFIDNSYRNSQSYLHRIETRYKPSRKMRKSKSRRLSGKVTPILLATNDGLYFRSVFRKSQQENGTLISCLADISLSSVSGKKYLRKNEALLASKSIIRPDLELVEEDFLTTALPNKNAKSVRFSQRVNEIPNSDASGDSSRDSSTIFMTCPQFSSSIPSRNLLHRRLSEPSISNDSWNMRNKFNQGQSSS